MAATLAALVFVVSVAGAAPLDVVTVKIYRGPDGQELDFATLRPISDKRALVRVRAANSELDDLVVLGTVTAGGEFVTRIHGSDWSLVRFSDGRAAVSAPGIQPFNATYKDLANDGVASELTRAHAEQFESDQLTLLEKKEFPHLVRKYEALAKEGLVSLNKTCGSTLTFTFRWATFTDDDMGERDVWSLCEPVLRAARTNCRALKGFTELKCQGGTAFDLAEVGKVLVFTTTEKGQSAGPTFTVKALGKL